MLRRTLTELRRILSELRRTLTELRLTLTAARSRQDSWASPAEKIRPLEKKLGRKPATPKII